MKLISPWKNKRKIILIVILVFLVGGAFFWRLNNLLAEVKFATSLRERTLLIVIENDFGVSSEMEKYYEKYKNLADIFFSFIFKVNKRDLNGKNLAEVIDSYGEDYLAGRFKSAAKGYGKVVILTDEKASYNNFKETLVSLNDEGKIIDILLNI
ncbi:MAG: hypothetical protein NTY11_00835 [Candidatus Parcubacteria bacterium]|nr:hypothetical protein [Candidatus Parcubacteria bacterium]